MLCESARSRHITRGSPVQRSHVGEEADLTLEQEQRRGEILHHGGRTIRRVLKNHTEAEWTCRALLTASIVLLWCIVTIFRS